MSTTENAAPATRTSSPAALSGRLAAGPAALWHDEVLGPHFEYELAHLLPWYIAIEKVLLVEYQRMGVIDDAEAGALGAALDSADAAALVADPAANMSDITFALERHVEQRLPRPVPAWHVDRSRNDLQACAQLMFGRSELAAAAGRLLDFGTAVHRLALSGRHLPMPGHTHFQAAQIITPGYYLAAVSEQILHTLRRFLSTYDGLDACPIASGAMAGQELAWDRPRMSRLLGFQRAQPVALTGVASRGWVAEVTAEMGILGLALSRFSTDLLTWSSSEFGFLDLPDELCGISSAMPQKKNFPVLERIRGRTAHLTTYHLDAVLGQRNTPYTNLVEVGKEAGANLATAYRTLNSVLRLFTEVVERLEFRGDRMRAACEREYLGGFSLANALTLKEQLPWRQAQVVAGAYIVAAMEAGHSPDRTDPRLLEKVASDRGFTLTDPAAVLAALADVDAGLRRHASTGSAHPDATLQVLREQEGEYASLRAEWERRAGFVDAGFAETDDLLGAGR
ncbi:argininosuccinate lyase [Streptomyces sp. NBC_01408]|uniref:argininosuccinate lyase n=1 Tax=Streptomyces sp. NBC_01408 TaxID=2903855 RepID=UPI00224E6163|nr:lyase family protein [Streptomyces sp. NBC_01408]MCX4692895.1 lyase family protein [Streptomyces sp. NBC_01408]